MILSAKPQTPVHARLYTIVAIVFVAAALVSMLMINANTEANRLVIGIENARIDGVATPGG